MNSNNRDFKGIWIPKDLYLNEKLNWTEKILLIEIDSLDNKKGCYASNEYFAKFVNKSKRYVSKSISKLKKLGYVYQEDFDGRHRVLRSKMQFKLKPASNTDNKQGRTKVPGGDEQKFHHNNTTNNKKKTTTVNSRKDIHSKKEKKDKSKNKSNVVVVSGEPEKEKAYKFLKSQGISKKAAKEIIKHKTFKLIKHLTKKVKSNKNVKDYQAYLVKTLKDDPRETLPINSPKTPSKTPNKTKTKNKLKKVDSFLQHLSGKERRKKEKEFLKFLKQKENDRNGVFLKQFKELLKEKLPAPEEVDSNIKFLIYDCFFKKEKQMLSPNKIPQFSELK